MTRETGSTGAPTFGVPRAGCDGDGTLDPPLVVGTGAGAVVAETTALAFRPR